MRIIELNTIRGGMTRLRTKGGADPRTLYDLLNGYVTAQGTIEGRPGSTQQHQLPAGTIGLTPFSGKLHVFAHQPVTMTDSRFVCNVLRHPTNPNVELAKIHYAEPFMEALYVAAEFEDGQVYHYWLRTAQTWQPETVYAPGDEVQPTSDNGFVYTAGRSGNAEQAWAPGIERAVNDVVEPTTPNGFKYTVVEVAGTNPASGQTEPDWPEYDGGRVTEFTDAEASPAPEPPPAPPSTTLPPGTRDRYGGGPQEPYPPTNDF